MCLVSKISGTVREIPRDRLLFFTGKRFLHCTEPWQGRRVVLVAYTLMGSISIAPELEERLEALGVPTPTSLDVEYYFQNPVGPGQPEQSRLPFVPKRSSGVWKAGLLNHNMVGCMSVDSLDSQDMETSNCVVDRCMAVEGVCSVVSIHDTESAKTQDCQEREAVNGVQHTYHLDPSSSQLELR